MSEDATNVTPITRARRSRRKGQLPELCEDALALHFAEAYRAELRYVAMWGKWFRWDGTRWEPDSTLLAYDLVRRLGREVVDGREKERGAAALVSAKGVAGIASLARSDRRLAATVDQWDVDQWLLNTPGGVVDLRTGNLRAHDPGDYQTRITAVAPAGDCPTFRRFLDRVTAGNVELQAFLQREFGYALTGSIQEHALFFHHGTGANGKSVLLSTVSGILGDYHKAAPIETFTASATQRHETELAMLRGARLITAVETEEGRRWAEARIKTLTGGDRIAARFMRQDYFEFVPQFKLVIAGNHKPGLRSVDEAIRRRFHLIPHNVTIPVDERDPALAEKLKREWPGILRWLIDGCADWQERGLAPPEIVTSATAAYLEAEDAMAAWIDEACERNPNAWEPSPALFASWKAWAERSGEPHGDTRRFRDRLEARGVHHKRERTGRAGYQGLKLKSPEEPDFTQAHWTN